jgi:DNA gyrase subunit A
MNLTPIIKESFQNYAGAVLQSRALVDVRDCLKPSARQIFYCLYTDKFLHSKPFKKTLKAIGSAMRMYIHGDSSCEGILMRAGQPFSMRYLLTEVEGSYGNLMESGNWAAPRYTASRLSELSNCLFADVEKRTINEWRDNYDDTEQYPSVLPTKGFYNIVNGTMGIGVGAASSIPQFNLREVNEALIKLLWNPDIDFNEIYCAPDFATGAVLLNEDEVKESLKNGTGSACKLRSIVSFDSSERCLIATEIPYSVYTNTICGELEKILESDDNPGIDRFNDLTGSTPLIKIYLKRSANPDKILKYLYKNTSLQSYYGINMTMLENGRFPRVFTWKEALQAHIDHEIIVYTQGFLFDLQKIKDRLHVIEGLLKAISIIDEVIALIKGAADTKNASRGLQQTFGFTEIQAKAILDIKLARLAHLEISKLEKEKNELEQEKERIEAILQDKNLLKKEIEIGLRNVANKFGDERRTKILNISNENEEPTEIRQLILNFTNIGNIFISESSTLYTQKKGGVGTKFKLEKGEYVVSNRVGDNTDTVLFFSNRGNFYHLKMSGLPVGEKIHTSGLISIHSYEEIRAATILSKKSEKKYIIFITKKGIMKKSLISEYNIKRSGGARAIELGEDDEIVSILFTNEEPCGILTAEGNLLLTQTKDVRAIGRIAKGIRGIKLNDNDYVVSARPIPNSTKKIMSISGLGLSKKTDITEFTYTGKNTKGKKIQKIINSDFMVDFIPITTEKEILVVSSGAQLKVSLDEITNLSRGAQGSKTIKLKNNEKVISLQKI